MKMIKLLNGDCLDVIKEIPDNFIGIELDKNYFDIAQNRINKLRGTK